jgi:hypothetical protein
MSQLCWTDSLQHSAPTWRLSRKLYPMNTCKDCLFWNFQQEGKKDYEPHQCLCHPPTWRSHHALPTGWFCDFPETFDDQWCGCWKPRQRAHKKVDQVCAIVQHVLSHVNSEGRGNV